MSAGATNQAWIVRAEGGMLLAEFEQQEHVAIRGGKPGQAVVRDLAWADEEEIALDVRECGLGASFTRMLRDFVHRIQVGDTVLTPGPPGGDVLVGRAARWRGRLPRDRFPVGFWAGKMAAVSRVDPTEIPRG